MSGPAPDGTHIRALYVVEPKHWDLIEKVLAVVGMRLIQINDDKIPAYCLTPDNPKES